MRTKIVKYALAINGDSSSIVYMSRRLFSQAGKMNPVKSLRKNT